MDRTKKGLITLLVIGALATIGVGTYATFTATTANQNNTFATGTLLLSNTVRNASACVSTAGSGAVIGTGNSNTTCSAVIANTAANKPGDSTFGAIMLKNVGTVTPASLTVQASTCTTGNRSGETVYGTASNFCTAVDGYLQEETASGATTSGSLSGAAVTSVPVNALTAGQAAQLTVGTPFVVGDGTNVQSFVVAAAPGTGATAITVTSTNLGSATLASGATVYTPSNCRWGTGTTTCSFSSSYTINSGANPLTATTTLTGGLAPGTPRIFVLGLEVDSTTADNTYQGLQGTFNLTWQIQ